MEDEKYGIKAAGAEEETAQLETTEPTAEEEKCAGGGPRKRKIKRGTAAAACIAAACVITAAAAAGAAYTRSAGYTAGNGEGSATGETAAAAVAELYGESAVTELADYDNVPKGGDALEWIVENSTYSIDEEYLAAAVDTDLLAAESTALAYGMDYDEYLEEAFGMTEEEYSDARYALREEFVKERLAAYEIAGNEGISVSVTEYRHLLQEYAEEFGYEDAETFEAECDNDSIAVEMLYDKVVEWLG